MTAQEKVRDQLWKALQDVQILAEREGFGYGTEMVADINKRLIEEIANRIAGYVDYLEIFDPDFDLETFKNEWLAKNIKFKK